MQFKGLVCRSSKLTNFLVETDLPVIITDRMSLKGILYSDPCGRLFYCPLNINALKSLPLQGYMIFAKECQF